RRLHPGRSARERTGRKDVPMDARGRLPLSHDGRGRAVRMGPRSRGGPGGGQSERPQALHLVRRGRARPVVHRRHRDAGAGRADAAGGDSDRASALRGERHGRLRPGRGRSRARSDVCDEPAQRVHRQGMPDRNRHEKARAHGAALPESRDARSRAGRSPRGERTMTKTTRGFLFAATFCLLQLGGATASADDVTAPVEPSLEHKLKALSPKQREFLEGPGPLRLFPSRGKLVEELERRSPDEVRQLVADMMAAVAAFAYRPGEDMGAIPLNPESPQFNSFKVLKPRALDELERAPGPFSVKRY